jgi:hypothetical protein
LFALLFGVGLFIAFPALSNYWFGDDFFLVRPYTNDELLRRLVSSHHPPITVVYWWT